MALLTPPYYSTLPVACVILSVRDGRWPTKVSDMVAAQRHNAYARSSTVLLFPLSGLQRTISDHRPLTPTVPSGGLSAS